MADTTLTLPAPAKLNLFLHITGRRPDGYHHLQTVFQLLDHGDQLAFKSNEDGELSLDSNEPELLGPDNLVLKAARLLQDHSGCRRGVHITLHKRLPLGGGLGGGSSDAATTLLGLNRLWGTGLSLTELAELGLRLGADVPVFIAGRSAWAEGIGEILTPMTLPTQFYVVLTPPCRVATVEIFSHQELTRNTSPIKIPGFPVTEARNDCETVARQLYPEIKAALDWLNRFGDAKLTGTGASIFAGFSSRAEAEEVLAQLPANWRGFSAEGVNVSPLHQALGIEV